MEISSENIIQQTHHTRHNKFINFILSNIHKQYIKFNYYGKGIHKSGVRKY